MSGISRRAFLAKTAATGAVALAATLLPETPALAARATIRSRRDGAWNSRSTWEPGRVPNRRDVVRIDHAVTLRGGARVRGVLVAGAGRLVFDGTRDVRLRSTGNVVVRGTLTMRPDPGVLHVLRFIGVREGRFQGGGMDPLDSDVGLWVTGGGRLDAVGSPRRGWLRTASGVSAGERQLTLETSPPGWRVGDQIAVAPTRRGDYSGFEVRTIAAIDGATVTLSSELSWGHPAVDGLSPEVANLTRNARIEGTATGRTHVFIHSSRPQTIKHVAIRHVGPRNRGFVRGRYGLHFHRMGNDSRDSLVEGVVVRDSGSHSFVPHASHGITFRDCVAYNVRKAAYWWDHDRGFRLSDRSLDVSFDRSLAARVRGYGSEDSGLSAFVLTWGARVNRPTNTCVGCVAVGVLGGSKNSNGFSWPGSVAIWRFEDNLAHNNERLGIFVWDNSSPASDHDIVRFRSYHNGRGAILHGAYRNAYVYDGLRLIGASDDTGVFLLANSSGEREVVWRDVRIHNVADGLVFLEHNLPAEGVVQLVGWTIENVNRRPIVFNENPRQEAGRFDLRGWRIDGRDPRPSDVTIERIHRDTLVRVFDAGGVELFRITGNGIS